MNGEPAHCEQSQHHRQRFGGLDFFHELPFFLPSIDGKVQSCDLYHLLPDGGVDIQVYTKHDDQRHENEPQEVEVDHVRHVDDARESADHHFRRTEIPAEHRHQTDENPGHPDENQDEDGPVGGHVILVEERADDGHEALDGDRQQAEDGDLGEEDDDRVDEHAAHEVARQAHEAEGGQGGDDDAHEKVGQGEAGHEAVGDGLQGVRAVDG